MTNQTTRSAVFAATLLCLATPALAEEEPPPEDAPPLEPAAGASGKLFDLFSVDVRAGTLYRAFNKVDISGSGYTNGLTSLTAPLGRNTTVLPAGVGSSGSASHSYSNGYNRPSAPTPATGLTWFWGYQDASQISGDNLSFNAGGGSATRITNTDTHSNRSWSDDEPSSFGTYLETNLLYDVPETAISVGPQLAFSWNGFDSSNNYSTFSRSIFRQNQAVSVTDTYSLGGIVAPGAPYSGGSTGPGPVISNTPASRSLTLTNTDTDSARLWNRVDHDLSVDVFTFSLGAHASYDFGPATVFASAGGTLNVVDTDAQRREALYSRTDNGSRRTVQRWNDSWTDADVLWGAYLQTGATIKCPRGWSVGGFLRYDWTQSARGQVGPSAIDIDLDSFSAGIFAGFTF